MYEKIEKSQSKKEDKGSNEKKCASKSRCHHERNPEMEPLGHKFKMITEKIHKHQDEALKKDDLTFSQMGVLLSILFHEEDFITAGDICQILQIKHPSAVGLINRLEEKKMVERIPNPNDSRSSYIKLTPKAMDFLHKNKEYNDQMDRELVKGFSDDEVRMFRGFLDRIYCNIEKF